MKLLLGPQC